MGSRAQEPHSQACPHPPCPHCGPRHPRSWRQHQHQAPRLPLDPFPCPRASPATSSPRKAAPHSHRPDGTGGRVCLPGVASTRGLRSARLGAGGALRGLQRGERRGARRGARALPAAGTGPPLPAPRRRAPGPWEGPLLGRNTGPGRGSGIRPARLIRSSLPLGTGTSSSPSR